MNTTITPIAYRTDPTLRQLADRVMAAGGLDRNDVALIVGQGDDLYLCTIYKRNLLGKFYMKRDEVAQYQKTVQL